MQKKMVTEEQIALALREWEGGTPVLEVCRKMGVSEQSFYRWKRAYFKFGKCRRSGGPSGEYEKRENENTPDLRLMIRAGTYIYYLDLDHVHQRTVIICRIPDPGARTVGDNEQDFT